MSVATEFPPDVYIPAAARPRSLRLAPPASSTATSSSAASSPSPAAPAAAALGAGVVDLDRWRHQFVGAQVGDRRRIDADLRTRPAAAPVLASAPIRLTRRGVAVLLTGSLMIALAIVAFAWLSAPGSAGSAAGAANNGPAVVTVHDGESLWAIATTVAPNSDPRKVVAKIRDLNHLAGDVVTPGQQLRVR